MTGNDDLFGVKIKASVPAVVIWVSEKNTRSGPRS